MINDKKTGRIDYKLIRKNKLATIQYQKPEKVKTQSLYTGHL